MENTPLRLQTHFFFYSHHFGYEPLENDRVNKIYWKWNKPCLCTQWNICIPFSKWSQWSHCLLCHQDLVYFGDAHVITELGPNFCAHESISLNPTKYLNSTLPNVLLSVIWYDKYGHDRVIFYTHKKIHHLPEYVCRMMYDRECRTIKWAPHRIEGATKNPEKAMNLYNLAVIYYSDSST